jgi:integrase
VRSASRDFSSLKDPEQPIPVVPEDGLRRLLATCDGKSFKERRDTALILLLVDVGAAPRRVDGPHTRRRGLRPWTCLSWSARAAGSAPCRSAAALDLLPARSARHKDVALERLWLGHKGRLTEWGLVQMLYRRGREADLPGLYPHQLRHTFAHEWLAQGGGETDLMRLAGWKPPRDASARWCLRSRCSGTRGSPSSLAAPGFHRSVVMSGSSVAAPEGDAEGGQGAVGPHAGTTR